MSATSSSSRSPFRRDVPDTRRNAYAKRFSGLYCYRTIEGGIGPQYSSGSASGDRRCDHRRRRADGMSLFNRLHPSHVEGRLPGFDGATGWLNSPPLKPSDLDGKVVLVDFWTYTCINWLRTLGYVRAWVEKYENPGLVVAGVHTPEFQFERDVDNVRWAVHEHGIEYPVALDSKYGVWQAFANHYWPAVYIADADGRIRHHHFGEGGYEECERVIQQLLREAGSTDVAD